MTTTNHLENSKNYKYASDYIDTLDTEVIEQFLIDNNCREKNEKDLNLRMVWLLNDMIDGANADKYFKLANH